MFKQTMIALVSAAAIGVGFAGSAQANPIVIDDFSEEQDVGNLGINNFIPSSSQVGPAGSILGGFRDMQATGDADSFLETRLQAQFGELSFSNNVDTTGSGLIVWDGDDDPTVVDTTGLGGIDITQNNGWNLSGIFVDILSADLPGLELGFTIWDLDGNSSSLSRMFGSAISTPLTESFLFGDFLGNADFTNVGAIQLQLDGTPEIDAKIANIRIDGEPAVDVPEPMTSAVALFAVSVMGGVSLKRKQVA